MQHSGADCSTDQHSIVPAYISGMILAQQSLKQRNVNGQQQYCLCPSPWFTTNMSSLIAWITINPCSPCEMFTIYKVGRDIKRHLFFIYILVVWIIVYINYTYNHISIITDVALLRTNKIIFVQVIQSNLSDLCCLVIAEQFKIKRFS